MENLTIQSLSAVFLNSFQQLINQLVVWLPKLIIALLIWWLGKNLLTLTTKWIKKIDIPGTKIDNRLIKRFNHLFMWVGKFILALVILDYLGIGQTIIGAIANGLTLTFALALGIAFGQALKPEAENMVSEVKKKYLKK